MKIAVLCCSVLQCVQSFTDFNKMNFKNDSMSELSNTFQDLSENTTNAISPIPDSVSITVLNEDYWTECIGYSKDAKLNFTQMAAKYGYQTETHTVTTEDNYFLTVFRLVAGTKCTGKIKRSPVVMMHGLTDSADTWIETTPEAALGYLLSNSCYDVWLPNLRGNKYSKKHMYYTANTRSQKYWNFTFDEHGLYDLKAIVDYVLDVTDSEQLSYIGHSQGTTIFYILTSTLTEYNAKISIAICLAPIAWLHNMICPILRLAALYAPAIKLTGDLLQIKEIFSRDEIPDQIFEFICQFVPDTLCSAALIILGGGDPKTIGSDNIKTILGHFPDATSTKNLYHFKQGVDVDKFARYDYGPEGNLKAYGVSEPPEYDVTQVTAPVALLASRGDLLSVPKDVAKLKARLRNVVHCSEMDEFWGHFHYIWAKTLPAKLAPTVFELLEKHGS